MKTNKINRLLLALCVAGLVNVSFADEEPAVEAAPEAAAPVQQVVPFAQVSGLIDARISEQVNNLNTQIQEVKTEMTAAVAANTAAIEEMKAAKTSKKEKAKKSDDSEDSPFVQLGVRGVLGVSAFNGHKALRLAPIANPALAPDGIEALQLGAGLTTGGGLAAQVNITDLISVGVEVMYNVYRARANTGVRVPEADFGRMHEARVELHTIEIPVLARFNFLDNLLYAEAGFQLGGNTYGKIEVNNELRHPYLNGFAFSPAVGVGVNSGKALLGVRVNYNVVEYAENSNGNPWAFTFGITMFPFGF